MDGWHSQFHIIWLFFNTLSTQKMRPKKVKSAAQFQLSVGVRLRVGEERLADAVIVGRAGEEIVHYNRDLPRTEQNRHEQPNA